MARPKKKIPTAKLQLRGAAYRIYWGSHTDRIGFSIGKVSETEAQEMLAEAQLALIRNEWPTWAKSIKAVQGYALKRSLETGEWNMWTRSLAPESQTEKNAQEFQFKKGDILNDYVANLKNKTGANHTRQNISYLNEFREFVQKNYKKISSR